MLKISSRTLSGTDASDLDCLDNDTATLKDGQDDFTLLYNEVRLSVDLDDVAHTSGIRDDASEKSFTTHSVNSQSVENYDVEIYSGSDCRTDTNQSWAGFDASRSQDTNEVSYSGRFSVAEGMQM